MYDESSRVVDTSDDSVVGVHGVAGFDARLRGNGAVSVEVKWSSAEGELWDENIDYGGITASIGYRFSF